MGARVVPHGAELRPDEVEPRASHRANSQELKRLSRGMFGEMSVWEMKEKQV